jgi:hypothetical protein
MTRANDGLACFFVSLVFSCSQPVIREETLRIYPLANRVKVLHCRKNIHPSAKLVTPGIEIMQARLNGERF